MVRTSAADRNKEGLPGAAISHACTALTHAGVAVRHQAGARGGQRGLSSTAAVETRTRGTVESSDTPLPPHPTPCHPTPPHPPHPTPTHPTLPHPTSPHPTPLRDGVPQTPSIRDADEGRCGDSEPAAGAPPGHELGGLRRARLHPPRLSRRRAHKGRDQRRDQGYVRTWWERSEDLLTDCQRSDQRRDRVVILVTWS